MQQLCADTGCSLEDILGVMDHRDGWQERFRKIRPGGATTYIYIYIYTNTYTYIHKFIDTHLYTTCIYTNTLIYIPI